MAALTSFVIRQLWKKFFRHGYRKYEFPHNQGQNPAIRYDTDHKIALREEETLRPRVFVFAFKSSWASPESAGKTFRDLLGDVDDRFRPNAICLLDQCLIIRKPFTTETILFKEHVLLHFFMFLVRTIDIFPRYHVDLEQYFEEYYGDISGNEA